MSFAKEQDQALQCPSATRELTLERAKVQIALLSTSKKNLQREAHIAKSVSVEEQRVIKMCSHMCTYDNHVNPDSTFVKEVGMMVAYC